MVTERTKRNAQRLLVLVYDLSGGKEGVPHQNEAVAAEAQALGLFTMSYEEFEQYKSRVRSRYAAQIGN